MENTGPTQFLSTSIQYQRDKWSYILCPFLSSRVTSHQRGKVGAFGTLRFLGPNLFSAGKKQDVGPWGWPGSSLLPLPQVGL